MLDALQAAFVRNGAITARNGDILLIHGGDPYGTTPTVDDREVIKLSVKNGKITWHDDLDTAHEHEFPDVDTCIAFFNRLMTVGYRDLED